MDIPSEAAVVKYGFPIGHATQAIHVGDWVHSHDLATSLNEEAVTAAAITPVQEAPAAARTFRGFRRKGGVGIRNEIWIIPTVGCVNSVAETLARIVSPRYPRQRDGCLRLAPSLWLFPNGRRSGAYPSYPL